jgi:hypothetical protein
MNKIRKNVSNKNVIGIKLIKTKLMLQIVVVMKRKKLKKKKKFVNNLKKKLKI